MADKASIFEKRTAGVLLHPTSLPCTERFSHFYRKNSNGKHFDESGAENNGFTSGYGTLGNSAYSFVDFMHEAGLSIWQMLPTGPTQADMSPYQSISAHAGNPELISFDWLLEKGWVREDDLSETESKAGDCLTAASVRTKCAHSFYQFIQTEEGGPIKEMFTAFCARQRYWLDDFSLFGALRKHYGNRSWVEWPTEIRERSRQALTDIREQLKEDINVVIFEQFAFFSQWFSLKAYANQKGVRLFGDIPIFVGHDSADVWAEQHYFQLGVDGMPLTVAGVPPDYFSETGQHWGNPHYAWQTMKKDGFQWWLARLKTQLQLFDLIRIDHFRGFEAYWEIPGNSQDARTGSWVKAPGEELLTACFNAFPDLPLVAENLGVITEEVETLRNDFHLPGMLVLQFAFDGNTDNPHLPHNHTHSNVIYTGTHDNDTTIGWWDSLSSESRHQLRSYCFHSQDDMPWLLIEAAFASVGRMAIVPMQDFLALDARHRMNTPGTANKNWTWTFSWDQVEPELTARIRHLLTAYHRLGH